MKIELVKETKWDETVWYSIRKYDESSNINEYITGSGNYENMLAVYRAAKENPEEFFKTKKEVLESAEFSVPSQETN